MTPARKAELRELRHGSADAMVRELLDALDEAEANAAYLSDAVAVVREISGTGTTRLNASDAARFRFLANECLRQMQLALDFDVLSELASELTWRHFPVGSPEAKSLTPLILAGYVEIRAFDEVKITPKGIKRLRELELEEGA